MFKEIRKKIYNNKTRKKLEDLMFDSFAYCGDSEYPMFVVKGTETKGHFFFTPETEEMLYLSVCKLKNYYVRKKDIKDFEEMLKVYCDYCGFSETTFINSKLLFTNKKNVLENPRILNGHNK